MAFPVATAHAFGKIPHARQHIVHTAHDGLAVDAEGGFRSGAQRHVQHRAVLGAIDMFAGEHRLAALFESGFLGQPDQQIHGLGRDAVLGVVEHEARGLQGESGHAGAAAVGSAVVGEPVAQMLIADRAVVLLQGVPGVEISGHALSVCLGRAAALRRGG